MRLTEKELSAVRENIEKLVPWKNAELFLYGSRTVNTHKGGDIDLLLELPKIPELSEYDELRLNLKFLVEMEKSIGERKIDFIIVHPNSQKAQSDPFYNLIKQQRQSIWKKE